MVSHDDFWGAFVIRTVVAFFGLLPGRFMVINQAMGMSGNKDAGAQYLAAFIEETKASGFVTDSLARHKIVGVTVAPPGRGS